MSDHTPRDLYDEPPRCGVCDRLIVMLGPRELAHQDDPPHDKPATPRKARYRRNPYSMQARTGDPGRARLVAEIGYVGVWAARSKTKGEIIVEGWIKGGPRQSSHRPALMRMNLDELRNLLAGSADIWPTEDQETVHKLAGM